MFDKLISFLTGAENASADESGLQLQVAALLVEAASMDSTFDDQERATIKHILAERFDLSDAETDELMVAAEHKSGQSVQIFGFTRGMAERLSYDERVHIIEMLWEVAYADGVLSPEEDSLIRRVAGLIYVSDGDRGAARRKVLRARGQSA